MKRFGFAAFSLAVLALVGGCFFSRNDYVESEEFDLALPKKAAGPALRVGVFKNLSGSDRRFLIRRGDGQVAALEYQRWRLSPELLLQRCVYGAFDIAPDNDDACPRLNAVVYRFEFDERGNKACLAVDFLLPGVAGAAPPNRPLAVRADVAVPVKDSGDLGAARAAAMSECARLAVEKIAAELKK